MAYRQTSQVSATTGGRRRRYGQVEAMNVRLDFLPQIEAAKTDKAYQAKMDARYKTGLKKTKETEALQAIKDKKAEDLADRQTKAGLGLEATKLGTSLMGEGPTISDVSGSFLSSKPTTPTMSSGLGTVSAGRGGGTETQWSEAAGRGKGPGGVDLYGNRGDMNTSTPPQTDTGGSGSFWNKTGLGNTTLGSALGAGLTGYGAANIFSDKSEKTKAGWGALAGGLTGLASGSGMFSGALFGGLGGLLG